MTGFHAFYCLDCRRRDFASRAELLAHVKKHGECEMADCTRLATRVGEWRLHCGIPEALSSATARVCEEHYREIFEPPKGEGG